MGHGGRGPEDGVVIGGDELWREARESVFAGQECGEKIGEGEGEICREQGRRGECLGMDWDGVESSVVLAMCYAG
jgi:hypothetical protein